MSNSKARLVMTWGALITGVAAILLPFTYSTSPRDASFDGDLWPVATPFYLAILIGLASLQPARSALASARIGVAAWTAAATSGAVTMYFLLSSMLREAPSQAWDWFGITVLVAVFGAGAVLVLRRRGGGRPILAMQVAYAANALWCLIVFAGEWQSGAWCALVTVLIYVVEMPPERNSTDAPACARNGRSSASALARLFVMAVAAASIATSGCGGSPTQPSQEDRIAIYAGQWRALIGDFQVVVQINAVRGFFAPVLDGTGTAVSRTTGETSRLKIFGSGTMSDDLSSSGSFNISLADEALSTGGWRAGAGIGQFTGHILRDRCTWEGRYRAWEEDSSHVNILGVPEMPVTFTKD